MLRITIEIDGKKIIRDILVIDAHSHLGKDVDGAEMMNPMSPGKGTFDFWTMVESRIRNDWEKGKSSQQFVASVNGKNVSIHLDFVQMPIVARLAQALQRKDPQGSFSKYYDKIQHQKLIDQAVCFPFQDVFRDKRPEALYRASNTNVARQVSRFPVSTRMVGYMRCDPQEGQKALDEIDYWAKTGIIRGLKLHPRSEGWVDHINSQEAVNVLIKAASYNWPVIFDTRGKQSILDIADLIATTRQQLKNTAPHLLPRFKVIIAHFAQGNVDDYEVYQAITQPNTWGDLSMLHGKGVSAFLKSFSTWCIQNNIKERTGRSWSEFLLFGTDYPYFGDVHAKNLIVYLFNKDFFEGGGTLDDCSNILGLNQIRLLPEYSNDYVLYNKARPGIAFLHGKQFSSSPSFTSRKDIFPGTSRDLMYDVLAELIRTNVIEIEKLLFQFEGNWYNFQHSYWLMTSSKANPELKAPLACFDIEKEQLSAIVSPKDYKWNPQSLNFFSLEFRKSLRDAFSLSYPVVSEREGVSLLKSVYVVQ